MIHGIRIENGKALWYRNKFVSSPFGFGPNTHVLKHGEKIYALVEGGVSPVIMDSEMNFLEEEPFPTADDKRLSFGYNNLVSDMRALPILRETGCPVVFDATHSVQFPGGRGVSSGGDREMVPVLSRAAIATGVHGLFLETHPDPKKALCDGPCALPLQKLDQFLNKVKNLDDLIKEFK